MTKINYPIVVIVLLGAVLVALKTISIASETSLPPSLSGVSTFSKTDASTEIVNEISPDISKSRYLSFKPPALGQPLAFRVIVKTSSVFPATTGHKSWVTESGGGKYSLNCAAYFKDWDPTKYINITGARVFPGTTYAVDYTTDGRTFSAPVDIATARWGDITGGKVGATWLPPDGKVSIIDVTAANDTFKGALNAPALERVDMSPEIPDQRITVLDLSAVMDAFKNTPYPFSAPTACPPENPSTGTYDFFEQVSSSVPWIANFTGPSAWYYNGKTYVVYQGNGDSYDSYILTYDHNTNNWSADYLVGEGDNDHGVPVILIDKVINPGQIHVFYGSHHSLQWPQKYARSVNPENITAFESRSPTSNHSTYPQPMQFTNGDIYLFYRESAGSTVGQDGIWGFKKSNDVGNTWSQFTGLVDNVENEPEHIFSWYGQFVKSPDETIHFTATALQRAGQSFNSSAHGVFYMYSKDRGLTWYNSKGKPVTIPVTEQTASQILVNDTVNSYTPAIGFDGTSKPYLLVIEGTYGAEMGQYFYKYNGLGWDKYRLPLDNVTNKEQTGKLVIHDANNIDVYASNLTTLVKFKSADGGVNWVLDKTIATNDWGTAYSSALKLTEDSSADYFLLFQEGQTLYLWGDNGFARRTF
ncbi:MAG: BNR-4 repeat-containing protein [Patescibacteria group bacterium]